MPSKLCESDGEIAFLVRFMFLIGCAKEVYYRPTSLMCIWMTPAVFLIVVILDVPGMSGDTIINYLMYADDLVLISPSATGMTELLCACEVYSLEHAIIYNSKKSTVLVCRNKAMRQAVWQSVCPSFIVNGNVIPESDNVKYLGHIICSDLSDDEDMMRQRRYLYAQGNVLS